MASKSSLNQSNRALIQMRVHSSVTNRRDHALGINTPLFKLPEIVWFKDMTVKKCFSVFAVHSTLVLHVHIHFFLLGFYFIFSTPTETQNAALVLHIHNVETLAEDKEENGQN